MSRLDNVLYRHVLCMNSKFVSSSFSRFLNEFEMKYSHFSKIQIRARLLHVGCNPCPKKLPQFMQHLSSTNDDPLLLRSLGVSSSRVEELR